MTAHKAGLENLIVCTEVFFQNHWNGKKLGLPPSWSAVHTDFRKIPNYDKQGVYAFVHGNEITYIGAGTSRGGGLYRGNGLSARVMKYCRWIDKSNNIYGPIDDRLKEAGAIVTIGFEQEYAYIANALEVFLISRLKPKYNVIKTGM
ncbi:MULTISPECIES: GIY-YIG nuclease family protein [Acinetobacter]|uniref:GIY-YIG nuclease family protein n=1 Tax=Acinetobacter TaxID=469 RepID=UPI0015D2C958|nr:MULTISPECIES: GIY-YIG nuclease family protein [Acinetobacter]MCL6237707.1 hypothetical protein [Acinetobacter amyesii]